MDKLKEIINILKSLSSLNLGGVFSGMKSLIMAVVGAVVIMLCGLGSWKAYELYNFAMTHTIIFQEVTDQ
jgi:hypothetical protein